MPYAGYLGPRQQHQSYRLSRHYWCSSLRWWCWKSCVQGKTGNRDGAVVLWKEYGLERVTEKGNNDLRSGDMKK